MNLFNDIAIQEIELKSPKDWELNECKQNLKVVFKETKNPNTVYVSVNLGGLTALKINGEKTTFEMVKGDITEESILERVIDKDELILDAQKRLIHSLDKAKISRELSRRHKARKAA